MDGIVTIWWISLVLVLVVTVPVLGVVFRFLHHVREIDRLARVTLDAALGIHGNTANIAMLEKLLAHATSLAMTCAAIDGFAGQIHSRGASVVRSLRAGKG